MSRLQGLVFKKNVCERLDEAYRTLDQREHASLFEYSIIIVTGGRSFTPTINFQLNLNRLEVLNFSFALKNL